MTRLSTTDLDGRGYADGDELSTIDVVSEFSGYGFTEDGRIKPEVVAPGDMVILSMFIREVRGRGGGIGNPRRGVHVPLHNI